MHAISRHNVHSGPQSYIGAVWTATIGMERGMGWDVSVGVGLGVTESKLKVVGGRIQID